MVVAAFSWSFLHIPIPVQKGSSPKLASLFKDLRGLSPAGNNFCSGWEHTLIAELSALV
jgi:hypothetical protein